MKTLDQLIAERDHLSTIASASHTDAFPGSGAWYKMNAADKAVDAFDDALPRPVEAIKQAEALRASAVAADVYARGL